MRPTALVALIGYLIAAAALVVALSPWLPSVEAWLPDGLWWAVFGVAILVAIVALVMTLRRLPQARGDRLLDRVFAFHGVLGFILFMMPLVVKVKSLPLNIVFFLVFAMVIWDFWLDLRPRRGKR